MDTITKTFPLQLKSTYVVNSILEVVHFRDLTFDADERTAIYVESVGANISLLSFQLQKFPDYDGSESDSEKVAKFTAAQAKSQKLGLKFLTRKNNTGEWMEACEITLLNPGRKQQLDFLPNFLTRKDVRLLEVNEAIGVQLIDYNNGLLKTNDFINLNIEIRIEVSKKMTYWL